MASSPHETEITRRGSVPGLTWRALLLGLGLMVANSYWVVAVSGMGSLSSFRPEAFSPFVNAIFTLLILVVVNAGVARVWPRAALSVPEMIVIYVMTSISTALASTEMAQPLLTLMIYPFWAATPENRWADTFFQYLPKWLSVRDPEAVKSFYIGHSTLYTPEHLQAWIAPVLAWSALVFVLLFMMLCINTLVRKQWNERERLTYPIVQLPLAMTADGAAFFRNRLLWLGFGIAAAIQLINGLNFLYPGVPKTPFIRKWLVIPGTTFPTHPFNAIFWMDYCLIPSIVGLSFLIPLDLLFSSWFFFLLAQVQRIVAEFFGIGLADPDGSYYVFYRGYGAYLGLAVSLLWLMKGHLREAARKAFGRGSTLDDSGEPMSYRWAFWGLIGGGLFLLAFGLAAGMTVPMIVAFFVIYLVFSLMTARIRAEVGLVGSGLWAGQPEILILGAVGSKSVSPGNLSMFTMLFGFTRLYRGNPMPHELEAIKMSDMTGMRSRDMSKAIMIATAVGIVAALWILIHTYYQIGAGWVTTYSYARMFGNESYPRLAGWLESPKGPDWVILGNIGAGAVVAIILAAIRSRFIGWPFHPIGYALAPTLNQMWMAVMLAWLIKLLILRYTGRRGYHAALPFFLGLMLGDFTMGMIWTLISVVFKVATYNFINL